MILPIEEIEAQQKAIAFVSDLKRAPNPQAKKMIMFRQNKKLYDGIIDPPEYKRTLAKELGLEKIAENINQKKPLEGGNIIQECEELSDIGSGMIGMEPGAFLFENVFFGLGNQKDTKAVMDLILKTDDFPLLKKRWRQSGEEFLRSHKNTVFNDAVIFGLDTYFS